MDAAIGRVLEKIRALGKEEDTLVLFLSDNGGCGQVIHNTPAVAPGPVNSYHTIDPAWANASNTPFRLFKVFDHEGGIATPLVASWPRMMKGGSGGAIDHRIGHVLDFLPTFADLAGVEVPTEFAGHPVQPSEGRSLAAAMTGQRPSATVEDDDRVLCWEFKGCRAIRAGRWKLVSQGPPREHVGMTIAVPEDRWELYDIHADRCEGTDLSDRHPDVATRLNAMWQHWQQRCAADAVRAAAS
jgi:arylsulfatase